MANRACYIASHMLHSTVDLHLGEKQADFDVHIECRRSFTQESTDCQCNMLHSLKRAQDSSYSRRTGIIRCKNED
jgi:hypothetical protein